MENKKDIGKALREKLDGLDRSPDERLWQAIEADLDKKKKRRLIPFWVTIVAGVLLVGLFLLIGKGSETNQTDIKIETGSSENSSLSQPNDDEQTRSENNTEILLVEPHKQIVRDSITDSDENQTTGTDLKTKPSNRMDRDSATLVRKDPPVSQKSNNRWTKIDAKKIAKRKKATNTKKSKQNTIASGSDLMQTTQSETENTLNETSNPIQSTIAPLVEIAHTDSIKKTEKQPKKDAVAKDSTAHKQPQRLSVFMYASPVFGGFLSAQSPLDKRLDDNSKNFKPTLGYGAYAVYQATETWSLRFGLAMINLESVTQNAAINTADYRNIAYAGTSNAQIYSRSNAETMDLTQKISYIEVPLEVKYAVLNKKLGINIYGGISYRFLGKNEISARTENGMHFDLGKTANLASNAFGTNIGIGVDYKLAKRLRFNLEPMFKYHLFDYKENAAKPYSIGILTGLQFSFE